MLIKIMPISLFSFFLVGAIVSLVDTQFDFLYEIKRRINDTLRRVLYSRRKIVVLFCLY